MGDVIGHEPARWPRPPRRVWLLAALAVVVAAAIWVAAAGKRPRAVVARVQSPTEAAASRLSSLPVVSESTPATTSRAASEPPSTFVATPSSSPLPALVGPVPRNTGVRLLAIRGILSAESQLGIFGLDSGGFAPVRGLPAGGCPIANSFRIPATDLWAVVWQPAGRGSQPCGSSGGQLYLIDAAAATARLIGSVDGIVPGDRESVWNVTGLDLPTNQQVLVPQQVQRLSLTGARLSRAYRVPVGWALIKGLTPDLLLLARQLPEGLESEETWQPSTGQVVGQYERVLAADATVIAWVDNGCVLGNCPVHLSAPDGTKSNTVDLPQGAYAFDGSISSDSKYLALDLATSIDAEGATNQDRGVIVELATRAVHVVPQTTIAAGETGGLGLNWGGPHWLIVNTFGGGTSQLGAYNPTTGAFVVPPHPPLADVSLTY